MSLLTATLLLLAVMGLWTAGLTSEDRSGPAVAAFAAACVICATVIEVLA